MKLGRYIGTLGIGLGLQGPLWSQETQAPDLVVRGVSFEGNRAIDDYTLGISIATSPSTRPFPASLPGLHWLLPGERRYFDETEFRRDVLRVGLLYRQSGYFDVKVDTVVRRGKSDVHVRFLISEGEPVRVTEIRVTATEEVLPVREILRDIPLQTGRPFNRFLLQASADTIRSVLQNRGYPFVEVYRSFDEDRAARTAQVAFNVDPGPRARISAVAVTGAQRIPASVVRRSVGIRAGQVYRRDALYDTQRDLYRMDLFSFVNVGLVDSVRSGPSDSAVAVRVQVTEGKLHRARAAAGYGALDCFRGLAGWTGRNFLGGGRSLDLTARVSKIGASPGTIDNVCRGLSAETDTARLKLNYNFTASLREPAFLSRKTSAAFSLSAERHSELNTFTRTAQGGELELTEQTRWDVPLTLSYGLSYGRTVADPAIFCTLLNLCRQEDTVFSSRRRESAVGLALLRDRSNSPLDPSRGSVLSLQLRYASPLIGSDTLSQFTKALADVAFYHRIGRRGVFAWRLRGGAIIPAELGFNGRTATFVPPDERLYAGGPNTVRGYGQNELGPLVRVILGFDTLKTAAGSDSLVAVTRTSPTGGNQLVVFNAELRGPFPTFGARFQGAVFVDVGQVFGGKSSLPNEGLRITPGVGLRLATPLGPIRLDVAYNPHDPTPGPLYRPAGSLLQLMQPDYRPSPAAHWYDRLKVNLSVGQAF